jgi:hypothetical protein
MIERYVSLLNGDLPAPAATGNQPRTTNASSARRGAGPTGGA